MGRRDRVQAIFSADRWRWAVKRGAVVGVLAHNSGLRHVMSALS